MPYIHSRYARRVDADAIELLNASGVKCLNYKKTAAGQTTIYGQPLTTNTLQIRPNLTDTQPSISLAGNANLALSYPAGNAIQLQYDGTLFGYITGSATDYTHFTMSDRNIFLSPHGTGKVKFGTKTGTGDVAVDGHLDILDAAGNAVKLATVA